MKPQVVVYVLSERSIPNLTSPNWPSPRKLDLAAYPRLEKILVLADRMVKMAMLRRFQAELERFADRLYRRHVMGLSGNRLEPLGFSRIGIDGKTLLSGVELAMEPPSDEVLDQVTQTLVQRRRLFAQRGVRLLFFPVPAKSTVHYQLAGFPAPRDTLARLRRRLVSAGVEVVDAQPAFLARASNGERLFEIDDNHWNAAGAQLAAELVANRLSSAGKAK